jgi:hypothetical protein
MVRRHPGHAGSRKRSEPDRSLEVARFTVRKGKRYRAVVVLTGFEIWASNAMIAASLTDLGFENVRVTGSGGRRTAEGLWSKEDVTAEIEPRLTEITELA